MKNSLIEIFFCIIAHFYAKEQKNKKDSKSAVASIGKMG
jgi:hypothetical protein